MRRQDGFTMVETLVGILLLVIGVVASLQLLDTSRRTTFRAEETHALNTVAQRELEKIKQYQYDRIALTSLPASSSDPDSPLSRVVDHTYDDGTGPQQMVVQGDALQGGGTVGGAAVNPGPTPFTAGDISGRIYRFVVWKDDPKCVDAGVAVGSSLEAQAELCTGGTQDYKRVIVALTIDRAPISFAWNYRQYQTDVSNPDSGLLSSTQNENGSLVTAQQFWLSDTACADSGEPTREEPADSTTNDTTGRCAETAKPDALLSQAPPDPYPADPANPPLVDFATDVEPGGVASETDKGLQMLRQDANGCNPLPLGTDKHKRIHWWATRRIPLTDGFVMTGDATLELWTRTIDDVNVPGAICVYLYERSVDLVGTVTSTPINVLAVSSPTSGFSCSTVGDLTTGQFAKCASGSWPRGAWQKLRVSMDVPADLTIELDKRLVVGISVEREGTPQDALQFMYDHPTHDSRFEVITTTPLH